MFPITSEGNMKAKLFKNVGAALLVALCTFGGVSHAAHNPLMRPETFAKFSLGFTNLGASAGFSVGADAPVYREYLRLGGAFAGHFTGGAAFLDIDAQLRPQYPIRVGHGHLAVYANVPVGLAIIAGGGATAFGIHYGVVPGVRYYFTEHWGVNMELGLDMHSYFAGRTFTQASGIWNVGANYAF
jgi:hypothetical protein